MITKIKHANNCKIVNTPREVYVYSRIFWGNTKGVEAKRYNYEQFLELQCNDPDCPGVFLIGANSLSETIQDLRQSKLKGIAGNNRERFQYNKKGAEK